MTNSSAILPKVAFFDLDGTLVNKAGQISEASLKALQLLRRRGIRVAAATGRSLFGAEKYLEIMKIAEPSLFFSGSLIANPATHAVLFESPIDPVALHALAAETRARDLYLELYTRDHYFAEKDDRAMRAVHCYYMPRPSTLTNFEQLISEQIIIKAVIMADSPAKTQQFQEIRRLFPKLAFLTSTGAAHPQVAFENITSIESSRANGLKVLLDYYKISAAEAAAFGDAEADGPFIGAVGFGVAMGDAPEHVKAMAAIVTGTIDTEGVATAVDLILSGKRA